MFHGVWAIENQPWVWCGELPSTTGCSLVEPQRHSSYDSCCRVCWWWASLFSHATKNMSREAWQRRLHKKPSLWKVHTCASGHGNNSDGTILLLLQCFWRGLLQLVKTYTTFMLYWLSKRLIWVAIAQHIHNYLPNKLCCANFNCIASCWWKLAGI